MPLSEPAERELLHTRAIAINGYLRTDGQIDIEAHMTDVKTYPFENRDRGTVVPGEPLHGMWMRMTVDSALTITGCEARMEYTPYAICPGVAPNFERLAGLAIKPGFLREAGLRVGGAQGCTHLRELLQQMATVAFQTMHSVRRRGAASEAPPKTTRALMNTCHAYASDGPLVRERWPDLYTGPDRSNP
ncbi:MAG: DUF2889 domain-containing protein [Acetobacteraceae bacterium]|nr:DUF2889 domain-containing protein [Acetobacteraceae bacterium]